MSKNALKYYSVIVLCFKHVKRWSLMGPIGLAIYDIRSMPPHPPVHKPLPLPTHPGRVIVIVILCISLSVDQIWKMHVWKVAV